MPTEFGSKDERAAVKAALEALKVFNRELDKCCGLGLACDLTEHSGTYRASFTKTTLILPE